MDNKFEYKKAQNKKFEKILIALMITARSPSSDI